MVEVLFRWLHEETYIRPCRLPDLVMRYFLSNLEFYEPIYIAACEKQIIWSQSNIPSAR